MRTYLKKTKLTVVQIILHFLVYTVSFLTSHPTSSFLYGVFYSPRNEDTPTYLPYQRNFLFDKKGTATQFANVHFSISSLNITYIRIPNSPSLSSCNHKIASIKPLTPIELRNSRYPWRLIIDASPFCLHYIRKGVKLTQFCLQWNLLNRNYLYICVLHRCFGSEVSTFYFIEERRER